MQDVSETSGPGAGEQPSEEQVREYMAQLRSAPAEQVVTEVLSGVLSAAQAKLGRRDGRLLVDLSAAMIDQVRPHVSQELTGQVDQALGQLRMAQVRAEESAGDAAAEQNDLAERPASAAAEAEQSGQSGQPSQPPQPGQRPTSGLWVPGRDF